MHGLYVLRQLEGIILQQAQWVYFLLLPSISTILKLHPKVKNMFTHLHSLPLLFWDTLFYLGPPSFLALPL